jgi:TolB protein
VRQFYLALMGMLIVSQLAVGADEIIVEKGGRVAVGQPSFAGSDAQLAATINSVVAFDLRASGYFKLGSTGTELLQVGGKFQSTGGQLTVDCAVTRRDKGETIMSRRYTGTTAAARALCHQISDEIVEAVGKYSGQPMTGIAQTRVAFIYKRGRAGELAVMDYDGHNIAVLTKDGGISAHPRWVNGNQIVYMSYKSGAPCVYLVDLRTNQRSRVAAFPGLNTGASAAPGGGRLAIILSKDGNPELYTMGVDGGGAQRLTRTRGAESSPCWSPDGAQIAYVSDDRGTPQVYVMRAGGGEPRRLTTHANYCTEPDWSPLGDRLLVTSRVGGVFGLYVVDAASGAAAALQTGGGEAMDATWSPNGKAAVFSRTASHRSTLALVDVDAQEVIALPALDGECAEPAWGPRARR